MSTRCCSSDGSPPSPDWEGEVGVDWVEDGLVGPAVTVIVEVGG